MSARERLLEGVRAVQWPQGSFESYSRRFKERCHVRTPRRVAMQHGSHSTSKRPEATQPRPACFLPWQLGLTTELLQHLHIKLARETLSCV